MVLAHAEHRAAVGRDLAVGPAIGPRRGRLGRHGDRLAAGLDAVEALVHPAREPRRPRPDPPRAAAVLVGGRAGVPPGAAGPRASCRPTARHTSCVRPPSSGRCSLHQTSPPSSTTAPKPTAARTTSSEVIGVGHDPNGSTAGADGAAGSAMAADRTEAAPPVLGAGRRSTGRRIRGRRPGSHRAWQRAPHPRRGTARTRAGTSSGSTMTLADFRSTVGTLTPAQRATVVRQATAMIDGLYVHLPLKRAMHATEPVQRLRLLAQRLPALSERQFHDELIDIFTDLRDLHTNYVLPAPFADKTAVLPFLVEEYVDKGKVRYLVTKVAQGVTAPGFVPGVTVTSLERHRLRPGGGAERRPPGRQQRRRPPRPGARGHDDPLAGHEPAARRGLGRRRLHRLGRPGAGVPLPVARPRSGPGAQRRRPVRLPQRRRPQPRHRRPLRSGAPGEEAAVQPRRRRPRGGLPALPQGRRPGQAGRGRRVDHARRVLVPAGRRTGRTVRLHPDLDVLGRRRRAVPRRVHPHRRAAPPEGADPRRAGQRRRPHHRGREPAAAADAADRRAQPPVVPEHAADARPVPALRLRLAVGAVDRPFGGDRRAVLPGPAPRRSHRGQPARPALPGPGRARDRRALLQRDRHLRRRVPGQPDRSGARCQRQHRRRRGERLGPRAAAAAVPGAQQPVRRAAEGHVVPGRHPAGDAGRAPAPGRRSRTSAWCPTSATP